MSKHNKCEGCKHEDKNPLDYPCRACKRNWSDKYKPKKRSDSPEIPYDPFVDDIK